MSDFTIACVLRTGGDYDAEYVNRLSWAASRYDPGAAFVCLSDVKLDIPTIRLESQYPGWLAKLELFRKGLFVGPVVYVDLDTIITGSLRRFARSTPGFTMLSDFYHPEKAASGVMSWYGDYSHIYERFDIRHIPHFSKFAPYGGDAGWIVREMGHLPDRFSHGNAILSYKVDIRHKDRARYSKETSLICFHGKPRPSAVNWLEGLI